MANTAGNLGTTWGWGLGENNWKAAHDKNLRAFDALVQCHIIERVLTTPPATPADGDCYIPATGATGAWTGHANEIARWNASASVWEFWVPRKGWEVFNESDNYAYRWSGTAWAGCNFSYSQLDLNYYMRSGETATINTSGGFSTSGVTRISSGGVGTFTGLNSSGGGAITGGKFTLAPATAAYASLNIPTRSASVTSAVDGDIQNDGSSLSVKGLGWSCARAASDTVTAGSFIALADALSATKAWATQLGSGNTLDFWNYASLSWGSAPRHRMTANGMSFAAGASDTVGTGTMIDLRDAMTSPTKAWGIQLGSTNSPIDFWFWNGTAWAKKVQFSSAGGVGFFGTAAPTSKPSVTGSRGGNSALASLLTMLANCGIISDTTTA